MSTKVVVTVVGAAALVTVGVLLWRHSAKAVHAGRPAPASGLGDVNGDGWVDQTDIDMIKEAYLTEITLTDDEFARADCNQNGKIDVGDYLLAKRYMLGEIDL